MSRQASTLARSSSMQQASAAASANAHLARRGRPASFQNGLVPMVRNVLNSPGRPLDTPLRKSMERRFQQDFSQVRIHCDQPAAESASALQAHAYTAGSDIVFGANSYSPARRNSQRLIAHELTHVIQQGSQTAGRPFTGDELKVSAPSDPHERMAEAVANGSMQAPIRSASLGEANQIIIQRIATDKAPVNPAVPAAQPKTSSLFKPLPYDKWQNIEARVTPELGIDFLEIGRVVTVDVKQQLYNLFQPYDDSIVDANQKFSSYVNIALAGAGNVPSDPGSSASFSITGGIGGAIAQLGQLVVGGILDAGNVAVVKQRANLDTEALIGDKLTTDSPIYEKFEQEALLDVRHKAEADYIQLQETFPPELVNEPAPRTYVTYARRAFGPHSAGVQKVITEFKKLLNPYLDPLKKRLDVLAQHARENRKKAGAIGGAIAGGVIGGAVGVGVGAKIGGLGGLFAGLGIAALGAGAGAALGVAGAAIFEGGKAKPEDKTRTDEVRAEDRSKLRTLGQEEEEDETK